MSSMFEIIPNEVAIVRQGGVYKEVGLAVRNNGELYVKVAGGFVRLYADGKTSLGSKMTLDTLAIDARLHKDTFGKLCITPGNGRKPLEVAPAYLAIEKD